MTYDDNMPGQTASTGRFIIEDLLWGSTSIALDVAVSNSASPSTLSSSDWNFYQVYTEAANGPADYPGNIGFNKDAVVTTLNLNFSVVVISLSAQDLVNGVSQSQLHSYQNTLSNILSVRPATEHNAAAGDPEWLVSENDGLHINVYKMTNVLSGSATFTTTQLAVNSYQGIANPLNPNGTTITSDIDGRIQKVAEANNTLVAAQAVGASSTEDDIRWYIIDVSSGTPTLKDQGNVSAGKNTYLVYPSIDINPSGQIGLTYMRSGTDSSADYVSMYVTGRISSDPTGTMEAPVLVPAGTGLATLNSNGRAGDLSGINIDPSNGSFWAVNEFATAASGINWGTAIANFTMSSTAGAATHLSLVAPATATAGVPFSVTVTALDANNNVATGYTGTIHFTATSGGHTFPADYTFTAADAGVHTFTNGVTLTIAGTAGLTVTDTADSSITGTASVRVSPAAVSKLAVTAPPTATAGTAFNVTVTAEDTYGNTVTTYTDTVHFSSSDTAALLPPNYTFTTSDSGKHTFTNGVTLKTAGSQTVTATDTANSAIKGSATVSVSGSGAAPLASFSTPASGPSGVTFDPANSIMLPSTRGAASTYDTSFSDQVASPALLQDAEVGSGPNVRPAAGPDIEALVWLFAGDPRSEPALPTQVIDIEKYSFADLLAQQGLVIQFKDRVFADWLAML